MAAVAQLEPDSVLAELLRMRREAFNALYRQARQYSQHSHQLESERVYRFLALTLQPIVAAAAPHLDAEALEAMALELTVLALDLIGKQLLGSEGPFALIETGWRELFCAYPALFVQDPRRAIAAISNALVQLCQHSGADPARWLHELQRLGGACEQLDDFLALGQILAWRCGMAHYRKGALALLPGLPDSLKAHLLAGQSLADWQDSPWTGLPLKGLGIVYVTGRYAGWGGRLHEPPRLGFEGDALLVADSLACWYLFADAWGESWFRRGEPSIPATGLGPWQLSRDGSVTIGGHQACFPELAGWRQAVGNAHTLAVAMPKSFRVWLIGLGRL